MKKPYAEPKMTVDSFENLITTGRPGDLIVPSAGGGEGGGSNGIIFEDEEY